MIHQPNLSPNPGQNQYCLLDDYEYRYGNIRIVVPAYFIYDGASIPAMAWRFIYTPFHPDVMAPALIHDWLYVSHQTDRGTADQILYDLLILNGANQTKAKLMHTAVKKFGGGPWEWDRQDKEKLQTLYILIKKNEKFGEYRFPEQILSA